MFQSSRKTMKWSTLLKDLREKVGLSGSQPQPQSIYPSPSLSPGIEYGGAGASESAPASVYGSPVSSPARYWFTCFCFDLQFLFECSLCTVMRSNGRTKLGDVKDGSLISYQLARINLVLGSAAYDILIMLQNPFLKEK